MATPAVYAGNNAATAASASSLAIVSCADDGVGAKKLINQSVDLVIVISF
jgi:hypothetical protein